MDRTKNSSSQGLDICLGDVDDGGYLGATARQSTSTGSKGKETCVGRVEDDAHRRNARRSEALRCVAETRLDRRSKNGGFVVVNLSQAWAAGWRWSRDQLLSVVSIAYFRPS